MITIIDYGMGNLGSIQNMHSRLGFESLITADITKIQRAEKLILPRKFNIDKRKAHLSALILSGQTTREAALKELEKSPYDEQELKRDKEYVLKKLGFTEDEFESLMAVPVKHHDEYKTDRRLRNLLLKFRS